MSKLKRFAICLGFGGTVLAGYTATGYAGKEGGAGGASTQIVPGGPRQRTPTARVKLNGVAQADATTVEEESEKIRTQQDGFTSGARTSQ
jgi:hypothetical protein